MGKKFLIIDDSALMRRVISDIIQNNSDCEVLDFATNGLEGFDRLVAHPGYYDLVILDINMPKMNGLEMLELLYKNRMHETVVVVSTVAKEGAAETLRALELGAVDFLTKPENFYEVKGEGFKTNLIALIELVTGKDLNKNLLTKPVITSSRRTEIAKPEIRQPEIRRPERTKSDTPERLVRKQPETVKGSKLVALACSTGGPKSLQQVIPLLPKNLDAPVVLVQHMPKGFTASLASRLDSLSEIAVEEASDGRALEKGHVYIAPGGMHIRIECEKGGHVIRFDDRPAVDGLKPCANVMYESLKQTQYEHITCVVLTGMGADGTKGIKGLKESGKSLHVISQNADTCVVYGMPRALYEAGLSDEVQPLEDVAESIIKNVGVM